MNHRQNISKQQELWDSIAQLKSDITIAVKNKDLKSLTSTLRYIHWFAAFLGLIDLADIAAGAASLNSKMLHQSSTSCKEALEAIVDRINVFLNEAIPDPSSGVFIDADEAVLHAPKLKHSVSVDDLRKTLKEYKIDLDTVSACRYLSVGQNELSQHQIAIPSFAKKQHKPSKSLVLLYINLDSQQQSFTELANILEKALQKSEILLHGPLALPLSHYEPHKSSSSYYLLVDIAQDATQWLKSIALNGRIIAVIQASQNIKENAVASLQMDTITSSTTNIATTQKKEGSVSFDAEGITDVAPLKKHFNTSRKNKKIRNKDLKIRFTVGTKLILIVSAIIIISMLSLSIIGLYFFRQEIANRINDTNISLSKLVARQAENELINIFDSANLLFQIGSVSDESSTFVNDFFNNSKSLLYVGIPDIEMGFFNMEWFRNNRIFEENEVLQNILNIRGEDIQQAKNGETVILNVSPLIPNLESPLLALAAPITLAGNPYSLVILADISNTLAESVRIQEGYTTTMIINASGDILAHPDFTQIFGGANLVDSPVFTKIYSQGAYTGQVKYTEDKPDGPISYISSYAIIPIGNLGVVSMVKEQDAFRAVQRVQFLNITLLGTILSLAILGVFFFSQKLGTTLKELALATRKIKARNYSISIKPHSRDEVGQLTRHFLSMIPELEKVDRFQERVRSFINPHVARMIADDNLPDHAETKEITVYFSDVRNFTSMSENIGDPQIVLNNLSSYFRTVVPCIEQHHGTVDKFIGDAIMAVWGNLQSLENSAKDAIDTALSIRKAMQGFNVDRGTAITSPMFHIGAGIHTGPASIGIIGGGSAKEEWGCIGDTINLASRVESLNKILGTDILITEFTASKVQGLYDLVPLNKIKVKGKAQPVQIYAVLGHIDDDFRPFSLKELRLLLGIQTKTNTTHDAENNEYYYEIFHS